MAGDLVNFRLSRRANEVAELLAASGYFDFALTAAKFALAYALKNHFNEINPATYSVSDSEGSNYGIGSLDSDGQLANLLRAVYPELTKLGVRIESEGLQSISLFL